MTCTCIKENPAAPAPEAVLALYLVPGVGHATVAEALALAQRLGRPLASLLGLAPERLARLNPTGSARLLNALSGCSPLVQARTRAALTETLQKGGGVLQAGEAAYPARLQAALGRRAPALLFYRGNPALLTSQCAAVVGGRTPPPGMVRLAKVCARIFAGAGRCVVSGGARGIDHAAHTAALACGGTSVVVLPQGLLTYVLPGEWQGALQEGRLLLLSEFTPYTPWHTPGAIARNATIAALAERLCVVMPRSPGGSLLAARHALAQGKPVFYAAAPGQGPLFSGCTNAKPLPPVGCSTTAECLLAAGEAFFPPRQLAFAYEGCWA